MRRSVGPCRLKGPRTVVNRGEPGYPEALLRAGSPPKALYVVGDAGALREGIAIVGARKATPYGLGCARRFARMAAERGVVVISGGARGCDAEAHKAALAAGCPTVAFLGGGCDMPYPPEHAGLFQRIVDAGGAVVAEHAWDAPPLPKQFRTRNRLIAALARATLIVEAGLPSGTFSTADEALAASRDVLVVPGAITSASSRGANRLIYQGATPIVDDEAFADALFMLFGCLKQEGALDGTEAGAAAGGEGSAGGRQGAQHAGKRVCGRQSAQRSGDPLVAALQAEPMGMERLLEVARGMCGDEQARTWLMARLVEGERAGLVARYPDGRWGPAA